MAELAAWGSSASAATRGQVAARGWCGLTERAADILVVDHAIDEGDHSAETRCQPTRLEMPADIVGQLLWAEPSEFVDTHLIGPDDPAFGKSA